MTRYRTIASAQKMTASRGVFDAIDLRVRPADEFPSPISTPLRASNALLYELSETPVCGGRSRPPSPPLLEDPLDLALELRDAALQVLVLLLQLVELLLLLDLLRALGDLVLDLADRPPGLPPHGPEDVLLPDLLQLRDRLRVPHRREARDRPDLRAEVVVPEEGNEEVPDLVPLVLEEVPEPAEGDRRGLPDELGLARASVLPEHLDRLRIPEVHERAEPVAGDRVRVGRTVQPLHDLLERLRMAGGAHRQGRRGGGVVHRLLPPRLQEDRERLLVLPELAKRLVHGPPHAGVLVLEARHQGRLRGLRADLPEGPSGRPPDREERVLRHRPPERLDHVVVLQDLPEALARLDPRDGPVRVLQLEQEFLLALLERELLQDPVLRVEEDRVGLRGARHEERLLGAGHFDPLPPRLPLRVELDLHRRGEERGEVLHLLLLLHRERDEPRFLVVLPGDLELGVARLEEPLIEELVQVPARRLLDRLLEVRRLHVPDRVALHVVADRIPPELVPQDEAHHVEHARGLH